MFVFISDILRTYEILINLLIAVIFTDLLTVKCDPCSSIGKNTNLYLLLKTFS